MSGNRQTFFSQEMSILNRGLNFCPKAKMDSFVLKQDMYCFLRQVRLKAFFIPPDMALAYCHYLLTTWDYVIRVNLLPLLHALLLKSLKLK